MADRNRRLGGRCRRVHLARIGRPRQSAHRLLRPDQRRAEIRALEWQRVADGNGGRGRQRVGAYASLAVDDEGRAHISYFDATGGDLKYARWTGSAWRTETVDSLGEVGLYSSLALDRTRASPYQLLRPDQRRSQVCALERQRMGDRDGGARRRCGCVQRAWRWTSQWVAAHQLFSQRRWRAVRALGRQRVDHPQHQQRVECRARTPRSPWTPATNRT